MLIITFIELIKNHTIRHTELDHFPPTSVIIHLWAPGPLTLRHLYSHKPPSTQRSTPISTHTVRMLPKVNILERVLIGG